MNVGKIASAFRPEAGIGNREISESKNEYKRNLKRLESIFSKSEVAHAQPMGRHRSKSVKSKVGKGVHKVKEKFKKIRSRGHSAPSESESLIGRDEEMSNVRGRDFGRHRNPGFRFHLITLMFGLLFLCAVAAFIFIPIVHAIASKYLWITFGGSSVTLVLSFIGMAASTATLLTLYIIFFKLSDIRGRSLSDWTMVICYAISALVALSTILIAVLHFHDVVEIFGEEFLELLQGYWITPKFHAGMDIIQMDFHCCGFYSYEDWNKVDALEGYPLGFIPFSCCSIFTMRPCAHNDVPRVEDIDTNGDERLEQKLTIYPTGCKTPMETYYKTMLRWAIIISSLLLVTQMMLLLLLTFSRKSSATD